MGKNRKKVYVVAVLLLLSTIYIIPASKANTETLTAKEKLPAFLNEVVGIDMPNYNKTNEGYSASYPSTYGGVVKRENYGFVLVSNGSILDVVSIFDNGQIYGIVIHPRNNSVIYSQEPSSNLLDCARNILEKYQIFVQKYGIGTSHVIQAADMLNDVTDLKNSVITRGNTTQEISTSISTSTDFTERHINIAWTYSAEGVDVDNKCLRIDFDDNDITFRDTWNLFTVGTFGALSKDEAVDIGWDTAQHYNVTRIGEDNITTIVEPDWSNMRTEVTLSMIPGQANNQSELGFSSYRKMGNTTRDPLTLYPLWQMIFYFGKPIGNSVGIQVGVWGDTKEISYCTEYGFLGLSDSISPQPSATIQKTQTPSPSLIITPDSSQLPESPDSSTLSKNTASFDIVLTLEIAAIALVTAIAITLAIVYKKRSK